MYLHQAVRTTRHVVLTLGLAFTSIVFAEDGIVEEIVVVETASIQSRLGDTGSSSVLLAEEIHTPGTRDSVSLI